MPPRTAAPASKKPGARSPVRNAARDGKVRKEFWLDPALLAEAQASLGAASERETVERALDLVNFRGELIAGARKLRGLTLSRLD